MEILFLILKLNWLTFQGKSFSYSETVREAVSTLGLCPYVIDAELSRIFKESNLEGFKGLPVVRLTDDNKIFIYNLNGRLVFNFNGLINLLVRV
jgi:hypothetical protein